MTCFKGKKILIVGLGVSGTAAKEALLALGADVSVRDDKLGYFPAPETVYDMLVLSPGVPPGLDYIKEAASLGSEVIGELELSYRLCKGRFLAITGTNGKTTTTSLVGEMLKNADLDVRVVGNIGLPGCAVAGETEDRTWLVTEVSSFQLETVKDFKPHISVILNITPDHMDRHKTMKAYIETKARIFLNQGEEDYFVVNYDDAVAYGLSRDCKAKAVPFSAVSELPFGAFVRGSRIVFSDINGIVTEFCGADELLIPGKHNLENALAAVAAAFSAGIQGGVIGETLKTFKGVEHRLEPCGYIGGVNFINDSKGTNPDASIKAVQAVAAPIILIAGGYDKKSDFHEFIGAFGGKVKYMVLLGETAGTIKETAEQSGFCRNIILSDMEECVGHAFGLAAPGDTVLLSPACASFDMYSNFEERGRHFKDCVGRLKR